MNQKWKITKVSTPEQILGEIKELARPVGIVLFGADCELKNEVCMECIEQIPNLSVDYGGKTKNLALREAKRPFAEDRSILVVLDGDSSGQHGVRHQTVAVLRDLVGAKTVVGIYAKFSPIWLGDKKLQMRIPLTSKLRDY